MSIKYKAADDYRYDANGNLTGDQNKNIENIIYNHLDLPVEIDFHGGDKITYLYNALGQKLKKSAPSGDVMQLGDTETLYLDGFQYVQNSLKFFPHAEGYVNVIDKSGNHIFNYVFSYTDHLGNIRMNWAQDPETGQLKILEENHYYPFGLKHDNYNMNRKDFELENEQELKLKAVPQTQQEVYKYKYNNQEWQDELGLNMTAMDFRQYDNAIGRFIGMDRLAELSYSSTPYKFAFNNPVYFNDPSGLYENGPNYFTDYYHDDKGTVFFDPNVGPNNVPKGMTYIGPTYTDPDTGTYWDEKGQPTYNGGDLEGVTVTAKKKSSSSNGGFGGWTIWGTQRDGDVSGWNGTTRDSYESTDFITPQNSTSLFNPNVSILRWLLDLFKNSSDSYQQAINIQEIRKKEGTIATTNIEPVSPPKESKEIIMRAFTYSVELNPFKVDTSSTSIKFAGDKANQKADSLTKRNEVLRNGAQYWINNPN